jgi:drug/metabolite transporter (DMT)-like permease
LTTCNPRFSAKERLIVTSVLKDAPAPAPPPVVDPTPEQGPQLADDASVSGVRAAKLPAILWGLLSALIWLITWLLSRRWGKLTAYAMGTPVFLVVLFVFFENFARLLPANV